MTLYLIGMMGAGKSTLGRLLAKRLGMAFVDLDDRIEETEGCSISSLFAERGEDGFRRVEEEILLHLSGEPLVIATGGGIVLSEENRRLMRSTGRVIYLRATSTTLKERLKKESAHRPLLSGGLGRIDDLLAARSALYEVCADLVIDVDGMRIETAVDALLASLNA